ncbi:hypothetical protein BCR43DRAFT_266709 [Syncephalastrum racemosum]|uniref:F-box domain-containing protein n=1 Tax=Syncephalastrum racemosum TaxID=13706 RepID=A0A1X2HCT4_SYNRA|nr:hypothetical protein BCR43DRAFT_266709 [Syncephalastrum racemosum]
MSSEHYTSSMSLESLLQEPYNAYQQADYDILETALEDALHAVLDWNAVRHANKGHFEKAMASALKLILMYPNSASGYLHAGGIQAELCDYRQAARYYARGVAAGVQHPDLKARLEAAQRRRDGLIDPVDALPGEVISKIFEYAPEKRVLCTRLSKRWRAVLLNLPMWHTLDIRLINVASHGYWQQGLDHYLKPHLQRLFLRTNSKICLATSALNGAQCRNIQTIGTYHR